MNEVTVVDADGLAPSLRVLELLLRFTRGGQFFEMNRRRRDDLLARTVNFQQLCPISADDAEPRRCGLPVKVWDQVPEDQIWLMGPDGALIGRIRNLDGVNLGVTND